MSRAKELREAADQASAEAWECETCSAPKDENDERYCRNCRMYWEDCDAGLFDGEWRTGNAREYGDV